MIMKRVLSFVLAFVMALTMVPPISAVEGNELTLAVDGLTVTHSETKLVDGDILVDRTPDGIIEWNASGTQIIAVAIPGYYDQVGATLTFTNTKGCRAILSFNYLYDHMVGDLAEIWGLDGDNGSFSKELADGESVTITVISPDYELAPATLTISNISLAAVGGNATVTFKPVENGSYTVNQTEIVDEKSYEAEAGTSYAVSATAATGYRFFGWYNETASRYESYKAATTIKINENGSIYPVFIKDDVAVFGVGEARFQTLTEADAYAKNGVIKTIVLMNDGVLTGEHTISAGNTLLIPYDDANTVHTVATPTAVQNDTGNLWENKAWERPNAYRTLTMATGAKITVEGSLNVGGRHSAGPFLTAGTPSGNLGMIKMEEGANITAVGGGVIYCWGYIYGNGTVTVKNGATVHENLQFTDFRGGNATAGIAQSFLVFPMTQYYVQNIEVAATFEYGAVEEVWGSIFIGSNNQVYGTSVKFIGPDPKFAMFVPGQNGSVTKTYLPESDRLQLDIDGDGSINPMTLAMADSPFDEENPLNTVTFVLPINNNMTININFGTTTLNQSLALLPGAELTIAKDAVLALSKGEVLMQEGTELTEKLDENGNVVMTEKLDEQGNVEEDEEGNPVMVPVMVPVMEPVFYTGGHNLIAYSLDQWLSGWIEGEDGIEPIETYYVYNGKRLQPVAFSVTGFYTRTEAELKDAVVDINGKLITDGFIYNTVNIEPDETSELGFKFVGSTPFISSNGTGVVVMNSGAGVDMLTMQATQKDADPIFVNLFMVSARLENADGTYLDTMGAEPGASFNYCVRCGKWYGADEDHTTVVEITWLVNGEPETREVCKGTIPAYPGENAPTKAFDETNHYVFAGWAITENGEPLAELPPVAGEEAFYAVFIAAAHDFTNGDCACGKEVPAPAPTGLLGDLDLDGDVDSDDLTKLARHVGKIEFITNAQALINADVNNDGAVDSDDLTKLARHVGKIEFLPGHATQN